MQREGGRVALVDQHWFSGSQGGEGPFKDNNSLVADKFYKEIADKIHLMPRLIVISSVYS